MDRPVDALIKNLESQIEILRSIYTSDMVLLDDPESLEPGGEVYEEYLEEHDSYLASLDRLDEEYDGILERISSDGNAASDSAAASRIRELTTEIGEHIRSVNEAEAKVRVAADRYLDSLKNTLAESRKQTRVLNRHYRSGGFSGDTESAYFDSTK